MRSILLSRAFPPDVRVRKFVSAHGELDSTDIPVLERQGDFALSVFLATAGYETYISLFGGRNIQSRVPEFRMRFAAAAVSKARPEDAEVLAGLVAHPDEPMSGRAMEEYAEKLERWGMGEGSAGQGI